MADVRAGSLAYNRLDMQVSQVFRLAIELYEESDYLLVLDHADDITLFDDAERHDTVSYYQMKTNDDSIALSLAISEGWIAKLYSHMNEPEPFIKELGLITNCPFKIEGSPLSVNRTLFTDFKKTALDKVKEDLAKRNGLSVSDIDLSKMIHMRTTLSIDEHRRIVSGEASEFLVARFPEIKVQVVKTIVAAVFEILQRKQAYERLPESAAHEEVAKKKGFTRGMFTDIIKASIKVNIPEFQSLVEVSRLPEELKEPAALSYTKVCFDSSSNLESFATLFNSLEKIIRDLPDAEDETLWGFASRCKVEWSRRRRRTATIYDDGYYLEILTVCICLAMEGEET